MADYRLKIKIGDHEFEAEGPAEDVREQFAAFKELVGAVPTETKKPEQSGSTSKGQPNTGGALPLDKIMRSEGRIVSLTVRAASTADAIMLLMLGQRQFRANDGVTGSELLDGLQESGAPVNRVDNIMTKLCDDGFVISTGMNRAKRYRLSNSGVTRAEELSKTLIATVP